MNTPRHIPLTTAVVFSVFFALTNLITASSAHANDTHLVTQPFISELDAVTAAANRFNPESIQKDLEYMGVILKRGRFFYYTYTPGHRGRDRVSTLLPSQEHGETVALWHTHGRADVVHRYFSPSDTELANRFQLPFYLADYTGQLKVFRPGSKTLSRISARRLGFYTRGAAEGDLVKNFSGDVVQIATRNPFSKDGNSEISVADMNESDQEQDTANAESVAEPVSTPTREYPAPPTRRATGDSGSER